MGLALTASRSDSRPAPARELDLRRAPRIGVIVGLVGSFVAAVGMAVSFQERTIIGPWVGLTDVVYALLGVGAGAVAGRPPPQLEGFEASRAGRRNVLAGVIAGACAALVMNLFVLVLTTFELRRIFVNFSPALEELMLFGGRGTGVALVLWLLWAVGLAAVGGASHLLGERVRGALRTAVAWVLVLGLLQLITSTILDGLKVSGLARLMYRGTVGGLEPAAAPVILAIIFVASVGLRGRVSATTTRYRRLPDRQRRMAVALGLIVMLVAIALLPQVLGSFLSATLGTAAAFLLMALGLNIVIGFAGLLDLGYVAFFAVGAYTTAVLTSPSAPGVAPGLTFWAAIPFVLIAAVIAGLIVGSPVLRMRGDYLAIVTLGFGEIARLIVQSDWQSGTLGGAQGIPNIPPVSVSGFTVFGTSWEGLEFVEAQTFLYLILGFAALFTYITYALQRSRLGRAWNAMREDEQAAEAMGVNIVTAKLWAFVIGAIMAGLGGALFATKLASVFPHGFNIIVSITVVVIVIVGGMGSVPGVVVAALVLVVLPEILREFAEFRFLLYGTALIVMMLNRPEGLIPSRRRQRELREEERAQDVWLKAGGSGTDDAEGQE